MLSEGNGNLIGSYKQRTVEGENKLSYIKDKVIKNFMMSSEIKN